MKKILISLFLYFLYHGTCLAISPALLGNIVADSGSGDVYTLQYSHDTYDTSTGLCFDGGADYDGHAGKVTPGSTYTVDLVRFVMYDSGTGCDVTAYIYDDSSGPNLVRSTSNTIVAGSLPTGEGNASWVSFTFESPYTATNSNPYWVAVECTAALSTVNFAAIRFEQIGLDVSSKRDHGTSTWDPVVAFQTIALRVYSKN